MSRFVILREFHGAFKPIDPLMRALSLEEASAECASLSARFPSQSFRIFGECGSATETKSIAVHLQEPELTIRPPEGAAPFKRAVR